MAAYVKFNSFVEALAEKTHNLGADLLKVALSNTAPSATMATLAEITQISSGAGNGYLTGGSSAAITSSAQTGGVYKLVLGDVQWTATAAFGPLQYAVLYNDTAAADELIAYWDRGAPVTLASGDTITADFDSTTGVLTIT